MFKKLLNILIGIDNGFRYYFWKCILHFNGGHLGKNVTIHKNVKIVCRKGSPISIGNNVKILQGVIISTAKEGKVSIGNSVYIGEYSILTSNKEILIEDDVMIAPHNNIVDFDHTFDTLGTIDAQKSFTAQEISIKKGSWIAANCSVLKGVSIGPTSVIGAGSVVTRNIPAGCIAVGSPARIIKQTEKEI